MGRSVSRATPKGIELEIERFRRLADRIRLKRTDLTGAEAEQALAACDNLIGLLTVAKNRSAA